MLCYRTANLKNMIIQLIFQKRKVAIIQIIIINSLVIKKKKTKKIAKNVYQIDNKNKMTDINEKK